MSDTLTSPPMAQRAFDCVCYYVWLYLIPGRWILSKVGCWFLQYAGRYAKF